MIENDLQYALTKSAAERFAQALADVRQTAVVEDDVHPLLRKAQEDSILSELEILRDELHDYERSRSGQRVTSPTAVQSD